jgi:hypothetical protein
MFAVALFARLGFEPRYSPPEGEVLPLDDLAMCGQNSRKRLISQPFLDDTNRKSMMLEEPHREEAMGKVHTFVPRKEFEQLCRQSRRESLETEIGDCDGKIRAMEYELFLLYVRRSRAKMELLSTEKILHGSVERHVKTHVESVLEDLCRSFQLEFPQIYREVTGK